MFLFTFQRSVVFSSAQGVIAFSISARAKSLAWVLIQKTITPYMEDWSGHVRLVSLFYHKFMRQYYSLLNSREQLSGHMQDKISQAARAR